MGRGSWLGVPLAIYSIQVTTLATLTDPCPAFDYHSNPLLDLIILALFEGIVSPISGWRWNCRPIFASPFATLCWSRP